MRDEPVRGFFMITVNVKKVAITDVASSEWTITGLTDNVLVRSGRVQLLIEHVYQNRTRQ